MADFPENTSDYRVVCTIQPDGSTEYTIQDFRNPGAAGPQPAYPIGYSRAEMVQDVMAMSRALAKPEVVVDLRELTTEPA